MTNKKIKYKIEKNKNIEQDGVNVYWKKVVALAMKILHIQLIKNYKNLLLTATGKCANIVLVADTWRGGRVGLWLIQDQSIQCF